MNSARGVSGIVLLCGIILCSTAAVRAQDLQVSPTSWDFGNVAVGTSETMTFDLVAGWPTAMWVYVVLLNETPDDDLPYVSPYFDTWSLGAFSLNPATFPALPMEVPVGTHLLVDVTFTPPAPGDYDMYLGILSNDAYDPPGPQAFLPLEGTGVAPVVPAPGAALLAVIGVGAVRWLRRRRML